MESTVRPYEAHDMDLMEPKTSKLEKIAATAITALSVPVIIGSLVVISEFVGLTYVGNEFYQQLRRAYYALQSKQVIRNSDKLFPRYEVK